MELPDDERIETTVTQDSDTSTVHHVSLAISDATLEDAGTYRVQATNDLGEESVTVSLIVNSRFCFQCHISATEGMVIYLLFSKSFVVLHLMDNFMGSCSFPRS